MWCARGSKEGVGIPGARVTMVCERPDVWLGNELGSSVKSSQVLLANELPLLPPY